MISLDEKYWHGFHKCRWSMIQMVGVMSLKATKTKKYQILTNFFLYFSRKKWSGQFSIFWYLGLKINIWEWRGRSCSWEYHYYHHHHAQSQCHQLEENPHEIVNHLKRFINLLFYSFHSSALFTAVISISLILSFKRFVWWPLVQVYYKYSFYYCYFLLIYTINEYFLDYTYY